MTVERAGDTELRLDAHDSTLHVIEGTGCLSATVQVPRRGPEFASAGRLFRRFAVGFRLLGPLGFVLGVLGVLRPLGALGTLGTCLLQQRFQRGATEPPERAARPAGVEDE